MPKKPKPVEDVKEKPPGHVKRPKGKKKKTNKQLITEELDNVSIFG